MYVWLLGVPILYFQRELFHSTTIMLELGLLHSINKFGQRPEAC